MRLTMARPSPRPAPDNAPSLDRDAAMEFLEDLFALVVRDARAGVARRRYAQDALRGRTATSTPPFAGVADRVGNDVLDDAAEQRTVGDVRERFVGRKRRRRPFFSASGWKSELQRLEQLLDRDAPNSRASPRPRRAWRCRAACAATRPSYRETARPGAQGACLPARIAGRRAPRPTACAALSGCKHVVAGRRQESGSWRCWRCSAASLAAIEVDVCLLKPPHASSVQLFGAALDAVFEVDRGLEQREGIALLVHRALDAADQRCIDLLQPFDVVDLMHSHARHLKPASAFPKAMPVKVWFKCMDWYCSPYVPKPMTWFFL
jgi:hypothetical protein